MHLAKLQALLLRLLATEEQPTLPLPPLSASGHAVAVTRRCTADAWLTAQSDGSQAEEGTEAPSNNVCRSQMRAVRAFRCVVHLLRLLRSQLFSWFLPSSSLSIP